MKYKLTKNADIQKKEKSGINLEVYPNIDDCGIVLENTKEGHNSEFYNIKSTFTYIIIEGKGSFFLDDEEVLVSKGDSISILPNTRIYFKGKLKMILITTPAWKPENEVNTRNSIW
jgi:mannose-6-phosphate isomerase-like protein (cupin superfamily)